MLHVPGTALLRMTGYGLIGQWAVAQMAPLAFVIAVVASPARADAVTFKELRGTAIDFTALVQEKIRRQGRIFFPRLRTVGRIAIGPGDEITQWYENTAFARDGRRLGTRRNSSTDVLGVERETPKGGHIVWLFSDDSLIRLWVFQKGGAGGQRMTFTFTRRPDGLDCAVSMHFAYEEGAGIRKTPIVGGGPMIEILQGEQISSSCRVSQQVNTVRSKDSE